MELLWKTFKIDLKSFQNFLAENCPNTDGIIASEEWDHFKIVQKSPLTQGEVEAINQYYDSLDEQVELEKLNYPAKLKNAMVNCKNELLQKTYNDMSIAERKIVLGLPLEQNEQAEIIINYGNNSI